MTDADRDQIEDLESQNEAAAKGCSTIALVVIAACLFSNLTCGSFSDAALISRSAVTASIPSLGLSLPVSEFLLVTPWLLLGLHVYFLVHLCSYEFLAKELSASRTRLCRDNFAKIHHSIFTSLFHECSSGMGSGWSVSRLERVLALVLAYVMTPFSILLIWFRALALHNFLEWLAIASLSLAVGLSIWEYSRSWNTLRNPKVCVPARSSPLFGIWFVGSLVALCLGGFICAGTNYWLIFKVLVSVLVLISIAGFAPLSKNSEIVGRSWISFMKLRLVEFQETLLSVFPYRRAWLLWIATLYFLVGGLLTFQARTGGLQERDFSKKRLRTLVTHFETVRVGFTELSKKPSNWDPATEPKAVAGAIIQGQNLRYMFAFQVFAENSHFDRSDLAGANLEEGDLRGATFNDSHMERVNLRKCGCTKASFHHAFFNGADLTDADLRGANLAEADFKDADLTGADLSGADLRSSKVSVSPLTLAQLSRARRVDDLTLADPSLGIKKCLAPHSIQVTFVTDSGRLMSWEVQEPIDGTPHEGVPTWADRLQKLSPCDKVPGGLTK